MKIILSRKGFDGTVGRNPSPILPDGTLLSLPIPAKNEDLTFDNLFYKGISYASILQQLRNKDTKENHWNCHLDPDIRIGLRKENPKNWQAGFGQTGRSQKYLENQNVGIGDLFLFFGWFRQTEGNLTDGTLRYVKGAPDLHVLFGYLQVGEVVKDKSTLINTYPWHPHSSEHFTNQKENTLYLSSEKLSIDNTKPGYGVFEFSEKRVLTKTGFTRAIWKEIKAISPNNISRKVKNSAKQTGLYYSGQWQELVLKENHTSEKWAKSLF